MINCERRSIHLEHYDYSQPGACFVTICTHNQECVFGGFVGMDLHLNEFGRLVEKEWLKTFDMRKNLSIDEYVVMPNHFHGIVIIKCRGILQYAQLGTIKRRGTLQRAPTNNHWDHLEEKIFGKSQKRN